MTKYSQIECETETIKAVNMLCAIKGISRREFITKIIQSDKEVKDFIAKLISGIPKNLWNKRT